MAKIDWKALRRKEQRRNLILRAERIKAEIIQIFRDTASYNENSLPAGREPIDPDPDGEMRRCLEFCNRTIMGEHFGD